MPRMSKLWHKKFILLLTILSLSMVGVSPACEFISKKSDLIEICTAFGIQLVDRSQDSDIPSGKTKKLGDECPYCFSAKIGKTLISPYYNVESDLAKRESTYSKTIKLTKTSLRSYYEATGPPSTL